MKGLLFTYLLTYGGAAVALLNPFVGLCIYVSFSILKPDAMWPWSVPPGQYSRTVFLATLLGWLLSGFGAMRLGRARMPLLLLSGFFFWCVMSAFQAPNQVLAWAYVDSMMKMHLPVLIGLTLLNSIERLRILAWVIVVSQGYVAFELNLSYLGGYNALQEQGFAGMDNNSAAIAFVTALGMAFFLGMNETIPWRKGVCYGFAALLAHAILFSFSRGGMLAMGLSAIVGFFMLPKRPSYVFSFGIAVLIGVSLAGNEVRNRLSTAFAQGEQRDESAQSRLDLWRDCWDVIKKNPVFGAGPDHWPLHAADYGWPAGKEAHSLWVQNAAELGIPGVLLLLGFYAWTMAALWPLAKESSDVPDPWYRDAARMVVTSLVGFIVSAQFVSLEALEIPYYVTLVGAGTLRLLTLQPDGPPQEFEEAPEGDVIAADADDDTYAGYDNPEEYNEESNAAPLAGTLSV